MANENTEATLNPGAVLHEALGHSVRAILAMYGAAAPRLTQSQLAEVKQRLADGTGKLAVFITNDGHRVEASIALIKSEIGEVFDTHLMKLHGPILAATAPAGDVRTIYLGKLN